MSLRNHGALIGAAFGLFARPLFAQNFDDGTDPFADEKGAPATAKASASVSASSASVTAPPAAEPSARGLDVQNSIDGSTGLLRTTSADSGATGTFRVSALGTYYTGSGFLCPLCSTADGTVLPRHDDDVSLIGTRFQLSATPADFLEAYASVRFQTTSNDQGAPQTMDIVGDTTLGVKAFLPRNTMRVFSFGGAADVQLLNSAGSVGVGGASVGLRLLGTADLTHQAPERRVPLKFNLNVGYLFDGSGSIAKDVEDERAQILGHKPRITRIERFGHDINRVDSLRMAVGAEGVFPWVHPFAEWSIDVPVNRQGYDCGNSTNRSAGDGCLTNADFSAIPSRATVGARVYPWAVDWLEGLAFLAAFDIGTGAKSSFIEEVAPELPWALHIGIAYAADTSPRGPAHVVEKVVERPAPPPARRYIDGTVQSPKGEPIAGAVVRYVGRPLTGMVSDDQGRFRTGDLEPGEYRFAVTAEGYRDNECAAVLPAATQAPAQPVKPASTQPAGTPAAPATPAPAATPGPVIVPVSCELEALPRTATINGTLRDAETTEFVGGATVTIVDPLGRQLALKTDAEGTFRFGNVPAGKSKLTAEADGYLRAAADVTLEPRKDISTELSIHKRPKVANVVITGAEIKLKKEVHFLHGSAEILPDSTALLEEAADVIRSHPELGSIEIQGHTDDTGTPDVNQRLSTDRANAVRDLLVNNGVDASRLSAHGYGQEKPLVPNTSDKNRAKNRRVQLIIVK